MPDALISFGLLVLVSTLVVVTAMRRVPGVGIILSSIVIILGVSIGPLTAEALGLIWPDEPLRVIAWGLGLGTISAFVSLILLEPGVERITARAHDLSIVDSVRGNLSVLIQWVLLVWLTVAIVEELIFRGFIMNQLSELLGPSPGAQPIALAASSALFGIGHIYQGRSGVISTAIIGVFLGAVFIAADYNLLLPILVHGFFDTIHLTLIWSGLDTSLRTLIFH